MEPIHVKIIATGILALIVAKFGKPWLATVVLTAILVWLDIAAHLTLVPILVRALIFLVFAGAVFWLIERVENLLLTIAIAAAAIAVLIYTM